MPRRLARITWLVLASPLLLACGGGDEDPKLSTGGSGDSTPSGSGAGATGAGAGSTSSGPGGGASGGAGGAGGGSGGSGAAVTNNGFPDSWPDGTSCNGDPDVFVWKYADDTFILRQSLCTNFEGPFWFLMFGDQKALLLDTGTGDVDPSIPVGDIVAEWLAATGKASIELVVANTHGHGDHVGGNNYFTGFPDATVVGTSVSARTSFFGISNWPTQIVPFDLGGRILDVIPIPGHQSAHIALYDRRHDLLLTGDTLYPGRLYIQSWAEYRESIPRLVDFVSAGNPAAWVIGTHIEMTTTPKQDFSFGASQHPNEHVLQLEYQVLVELNDAVAAMGNNPSYEEHDHFIIYP